MKFNHFKNTHLFMSKITYIQSMHGDKAFQKMKVQDLKSNYYLI